MATAMKKVNVVRQIVRLKHIVKRWKALSLKGRFALVSDSNSNSTRRSPPGFVAVYVGTELQRFLIPTRFLNLPIFVSLLKRSEEEFGFQSNGGLVLPCEASFFQCVLKFLDRNEHKFSRLSLDDAFKLFSEVGFDSCKEIVNGYRSVTPLLQKATV